MTQSTTATKTPLDASHRLLAIGLVLSVTLVAFESTALITALPTITKALNGDSYYGITLAVYTLANLVALVAAGRAADRRGPAPVFAVSIIVFIVGLVVAGVATSMAVVGIGRLLQGAGSGGLSPIAYLLVKRGFPDDRQPMMYVYISAGWVLPSLLAPLFSGYVTDTFGWRWVFFSIIPLATFVGLVATVPMRQFGPVDQAEATHGEGEMRVSLAFAVAVGVGVLLMSLAAANPFVIVLGSVAGIALTLPALRRLLPHGFFTARMGYPALLMCRFLAAATFILVDSFVPLAAARIHGAKPFVQGFVIVGAAISWTIGQVLISRLPNVRPEHAVTAGFALLGTAAVLVTPVLWAGWPLWVTFFSWAVGGLGMGILYNPSTVATMSYATDGREGLVSSQVRLSESLGFSLMYGVGGAMVAVADRTALTLTAALAINFGLAAACAIAGIVASRGIRTAS
ncbi:MAG: MFS transporter [Actinomycetota bacterium]